MTHRLIALTVLALRMVASAVAAEPATRPATVRVAAVQCSSDLGDVAGNRKKLQALVEQAADHGAKIVVLPEAAVTGYLSQDLKTNWRLPLRPIDLAFAGKDPLPFAETVPGPSTDLFGTLAKRLGVYVTVPLVEVVRPPAGSGEGPTLYNTVALMSPAGDLVAHYRKVHPWPVPEKSWATAGDRGIQTYDTEYGKVGLAVCFDIHETVPLYKDKGLWALLYPIAWVDEEYPAQWFWHELPNRVGKLGFYVIGANWSVDRPQTWRGYGFSTIISPQGRVLASATSLYGSEIVYADLPTAPRRPPR